MTKTILVTGCAGFIGSHYVDCMLENGYLVHGVDAFTYAGDANNLKGAWGNPWFRFSNSRIDDYAAMLELLSKHRYDWIVNFAAESHVDNSIFSALSFHQSNVSGVGVLLEAMKETKHKHFLQVSTDEVYGSIKGPGVKENAPLNPTSPYAATKAAADLLALSYHKTFGIDVRITRSTNNYGTRQHKEKFLPVVIRNALAGTPIPMYDDGSQIRDWLHVFDNCLAIQLVMERGAPGEIYNIGAGLKEITNLKLIELILKETGSSSRVDVLPNARPGHDQRYAVNRDKISNLNWRPKVGLYDGLRETIDWYSEL